PWVHIAAVHRDDGKTALYVDGVQVGRSNRSVRAHLGGGSNVLTIGGTGAADGGPFEGALDEVRIYNRAIGQAELRGRALPGWPAATGGPPKLADRAPPPHRPRNQPTAGRQATVRSSRPRPCLR